MGRQNDPPRELMTFSFVLPEGAAVLKADEPLVGEKSVSSLAKYIAREMPENDPGSLSLADATASAEFIHHAFYSAEARARNHPPRIELAHLTVRQYRESIAVGLENAPQAFIGLLNGKNFGKQLVKLI